MFNIIEPNDHRSSQDKIDSLLEFLKIYQDFSLSPKDQEKAIFIVAEDSTRGVYGGAVFYTQKLKDLHENISKGLFEFLPENQKMWCVRLCFFMDQDDRFLTLEAIELCEDFYVGLYEILRELGKKRSTNCLPIVLCSKSYRNSLTYGHWSYPTKAHPSPLLSDCFHAFLSLPDQKRTLQSSQDQEHNKREDLKTPFPFLRNDQSQTERPVQ